MSEFWLGAFVILAVLYLVSAIAGALCLGRSVSIDIDAKYVLYRLVIAVASLTLAFLTYTGLMFQ